MARILLIDDDNDLRFSLACVLHDAGHEVIESENGADALAIVLQDHSFDLLLCDVMMPELDGINLLRVLKTQNLTIPAIMMSGQEDIQTAIETMRCGALNYLVKPIDQGRLLASIDEILAQTQQALHQQAFIQRVITDLSSLIQTQAAPLADHTAALYPHMPGAPLHTGRLELDENLFIAFYKGRQVELTPTEAKILSCLIRAKGRVISLEELALRVQDIRVSAREARLSLSAHLANLRAKLDSIGCAHYLGNRRGRGYFITEPHETALQ